MAADFISADYGWLRSKDGTQSTHVLFRAGKTCDGYYTNNEILQHTESAMSNLEKDYADKDHIFIFDNATTHLKRPNDALSARHLPKNPNPDWGITVTAKSTDGKQLHGPDGKALKTKVPMVPGHLLDGSVQPLYFPAGHIKAGWFKGMATIIRERGFEDEAQLRCECPSFKCPPRRWAGCCCCRFLYNQPDFSEGLSALELTCQARGFCVLFLPKYHCELNFIEQCWGCAKRRYHQFPSSSKGSDLERNMIEALDSVMLESMHKYFIRSQRFMDAYQKGLNGQQAAWAAKRYHGHCMLPEAIMHEFDNETIV
ncbi:hypothetical protein BDR05DRAFT_896000 [Suillus weaverae]|nr:hypothetical protein BDR05DRAFT_896000 [Suillus weaverae]